MNNQSEYDSCPSFEAAFATAHAKLGPGQIFYYKGKAFSTNCADGGNYQKK